MTQAPPPDSLRAVLDSVFAAPAYDWTERAHPFGWIQRAWFWLVDLLERLRAADPLLFRVGVWLLLALLLGILLHAAWVMFRTVRHAAELERGRGPRAPAERRDAAWFDREADRLAAAGRYHEALHAAFTALALRLEEAGAARYEPSRTPREYVRTARLAAGDLHRLDGLVSALYRHAFAGVPLSADEYEQWRADARGDWHAAAA